MDSVEAIETAGRLYGAILLRDADEDGFKYYFEKLLGNELPVSRAVYEMLVSDEFAEKFVYNKTPCELAENLLRTFFGSGGFADVEVERHRNMIIRVGYDKTVAAILSDARCAYIDKESRIPNYFDGN